ncbi:CHAT domain-containing protein [Lacinutrix iliipiscaria]|uniref:CHAT domain-containing protein n=1 Tax=Lacinutrix iliipiscaria TaxID=1230532 RepID=A0ABW5WT11_9FLAO
MEPIKKLILHGNKETDKDGNIVYKLESSNRDLSNQHEISLKENDKILEFVLEDGVSWKCDPSTLHEVFPKVDPAIERPENRDGDSDTFVLPSKIDESGSDRGIIGKIAIKILKVFAKKAISKSVAEIARNLENKNLEFGIPKDSLIWKTVTKEDYLDHGAGLFKVSKDFEFSIFNGKPSAQPFFLFIHGTNSNAQGAFEDLKQSTAWSTLHETYGDNVLAFQHRTLTESPLQNAVKLSEMLPENSTIHMITHSRGGIVGDIINKYSTSDSDQAIGFSNDHITFLEKEGKREKDIEAIEALNTIYRDKKIRVSKFIRVGCPAAGTKLASKRLSHILNVFSNLLGGVFGDILNELVAAAIETKDDVDVLPGLEAQNPESPFIKILNDPSEANAIDGKPLAVISGNGTVSASKKGLLVILGRLFYWQRNDLVVNTDSMYLGAKRATNIQYFFSQGDDVNHVNYFEKEKTRDAINLALKTDEGKPIPGFKSIAQLEIPGSDRGAIEHGELYPSPNPPSGTKPIVVLLPGIMGSNLSQKDKEIWLHYGRILTGGLINLNYSNINKIEAESVVKTSYYKLYKWLSGKYDVVVFPFDWRKPLNSCTNDFNLKIKSLLKIGQPIKIIGHSMGGVLVRDFIISHNETWQELNASNGFKLVYLGSPLGGSHRIPAVLFGEDAIIKKLSKLDLFHTKKSLLKMFSKFPGILSLLPITTDAENDFAQIATWKKMREFFGKPSWPLPTVKDLNNFKTYRDNIIAKRDHIDYSNMVYIAGKDKMTPCGYYLEDFSHKKKLYFLYTGEGDQSVTWELGIPKQMEALNAVYYSRVTHGALANSPSLFNAIEDILSTGQTKLLHTSKPLLRGEEKVFRAEPDIDFDLSENGLEKTIFGLPNNTEPIASQIPVNVTISNGDLRYSSYPILAGHFTNDAVLYAEKAIDNYLNGSLSSKHSLGLYPGSIGTNAFFDKMPGSDFSGAIIVGLGEPDKLTSFQLSKSIEQAILNYLLSIRGTIPSNKDIGISSLSIASGYGGLSVEGSLKAIIGGVNRANEKVKSLFNGSINTIQHIEFVELYAYRALNCMYVLDKIIKQENSAYNIRIDNRKIKNLLGIRKRIPLDTSEDWWERITVKYNLPKDPNDLSSMVFASSTTDSREEKNELHSSTPLIDLFISEISSSNQWNDCTAKTLFELLIPNALKEKLKRKSNILWILEGKTASYPWELLQDNSVNAKPLCISAGMIRQLTTKDYRINIKRVAENNALIIADPILNGYVNQLPGARREGTLVKDTMENAGYPFESLIGANAADIVKSLFCKDYSIIHLAGHGIFNPKSPKKSGMVIGDNIFLSVFEIQQMPVVPELVFVNCCHLGFSSTEDEKFFQNRYKLAANIGTELIRIGVKAVIAAGWAVNDEAAFDFAEIFYTGMFSGDNFGDSVQRARNFIYDKHPDNNTWGAYQCYGDPFFKLKNISKKYKAWTPNYIVPQQAEMDLDNLLNKLEMATSMDDNHESDLNTIIEAIEKDNDVLYTPQIAERIAKIYQELALYDKAVEKYKDLLGMENAGFSFACMERYCSTRAKLYIKSYFEIPKHTKATKTEAYNKIIKVIDDLKMLRFAGETTERLNLLAAAYKRLIIVAPDKKKKILAYKNAISYYENAYQNKKSSKYSLINAIELGTLFEFYFKKGETKGFTINDSKYSIRTAAKAKKILLAFYAQLPEKSNIEDLNYWDMVDYLNIELCLLLVSRENNTDKKWENIIANFNRIWEKAGSEGKKMAELEHLQFLIHELYIINNSIKGKPRLNFEAIKTKDLESQVNELKSVINRLSN